MGEGVGLGDGLGGRFLTIAQSVLRTKPFELEGELFSLHVMKLLNVLIGLGIGEANTVACRNEIPKDVVRIPQWCIGRQEKNRDNSAGIVKIDNPRWKLRELEILYQERRRII